MGFEESRSRYEAWMAAQLGPWLVPADLAAKAAKMAAGPFPFLRATYWRWSETVLHYCPHLAEAPVVLAVGDVHLENFGSWRDAEGRLVWGINDVDEAAEMPYALDLLRLATSALLANAEAEANPALASDMGSASRICEAIAAGYAEALSQPRALVLDDNHPRLRALSVVPDAARWRFWEKMVAPVPTPLPPLPIEQALLAAMPEGVHAPAFWPRVAGAGSLGRARWVARADWHGGPLLREAKAALPSAWGYAHGQDLPLRLMEVANGRYRSPDPFFAVRGATGHAGGGGTDDAHPGLVLRRLSPNARKIEAESEASGLLKKWLLRSMGQELAAVHLGAGPGLSLSMPRSLAQHLGTGSWLAADAVRMAGAVASEQASFARQYSARKNARGG